MPKIHSIDDYYRRGYKLTYEDASSMRMTKKFKGHDRFSYCFPRILATILSFGLALVDQRFKLELKFACRGKKVIEMKKAYSSPEVSIPVDNSSKSTLDLDKNVKEVKKAISVVSEQPKEVTLEKTLEGVKNAMRKQGIDSFYDPKMTLDIDGKKWEWCQKGEMIDGKEELTYVRIESLEVPISKLVQDVNLALKQDKVALNWTLFLNNEEGRYQFTCNYSRGPGYVIGSCALFENLGCTFQAHRAPQF